jgi:hypothetical protein
MHPKVHADLLGHGSSSFTVDTYSHVVPSLRARAPRSSRLPSGAPFGVNSRDMAAAWRREPIGGRLGWLSAGETAGRSVGRAGLEPATDGL